MELTMRIRCVNMTETDRLWSLSEKHSCNEPFPNPQLYDVDRKMRLWSLSEKQT